MWLIRTIGRRLRWLPPWLRNPTNQRDEVAPGGHLSQQQPSRALPSTMENGVLRMGSAWRRRFLSGEPCDGLICVASARIACAIQEARGRKRGEARGGMRGKRGKRGKRGDSLELTIFFWALR